MAVSNEVGASAKASSILGITITFAFGVLVLPLHMDLGFLLGLVGVVNCNISASLGMSV